MDKDMEIESFPYPVTVNRQDFQNELIDQFDVDQFLFKNHRFTSIDSLIKDLTNLLNELNTELLNLVNENYNEFINLGKSIDGSLDLINFLKIDLKNFNNDLVNFNENLSKSRNLVENCLNEKKHLQVLKIKIKLLLLLNDQINNFENLLKIDDENKLNNLTSLYLSINKLSTYLNNSNSLEKSLMNKLVSIKFEFKSYLDNLSSKLISNKNNDLLLQILNIYKIIDHQSDFLNIIRKN